MNILIPNVAKPGNLGDMAILESLLAKLQQGKNTIVIHRFNPEEQKAQEKMINPSLYYWAAFQKKTVSSRIVRTTVLALALVLPERFDKVLPGELKIILDDYKKAGHIILQGGGYFRSKKGLTQQLNAVMNGIYILFAKKYRKPVTIRPMSFGPFSNAVTEFLCAKIVNPADTIYIRDDISLKLLRRYVQESKLHKEKDEAFSIKAVKVSNNKDKVLGFTVREWVKRSEEKRFLQKLTILIKKAADQNHCIGIQPIIQANIPEYKEGDERITSRLVRMLKTKGLQVFKPKRPRTVKQALMSYGKLSYLVGMRMHSCIFAKLQRVPFTAVAYEHKHSLLEAYADRVIPISSLVSTKHDGTRKYPLHTDYQIEETS